MRYLNGIQFHGWERFAHMTKRTSCRKLRYTFTLILCFVLANFMNIFIRWNFGKDKLNGSWNLVNIVNRTESTENQSSSSGIFPSTHTTLDLLREIQQTMAENRIRREQFGDRIIFMSTLSMYNEIAWTKDVKLKMCISNSEEVEAYAHRFPKGHWSFFSNCAQDRNLGGFLRSGRTTNELSSLQWVSITGYDHSFASDGSCRK